MESRIHDTNEGFEATVPDPIRHAQVLRSVEHLGKTIGEALSPLRVLPELLDAHNSPCTEMRVLETKVAQMDSELGVVKSRASQLGDLIANMDKNQGIGFAELKSSLGNLVKMALVAFAVIPLVVALTVWIVQRVPAQPLMATQQGKP